MRKYILGSLIAVFCTTLSLAQSGAISGQVMGNGSPLPFATIGLAEQEEGIQTDENGYFKLSDLPFGQYTLRITYLGYEDFSLQVELRPDQPEVEVRPELQQLDLFTDAVVVTGTRTFKRKTDSPVIVNVIGSETLEGVQACNLAEGLRFQPGLRVETDCQTCNYTQLRMNGLGGGYSQILINGRPIFSPLTGLYGLEQIPVNMIERIEVVRGGGSALYGSSAIGGTVNVITRIPEENNYDLGYTYQSINGGADDHILSGNATVVSPDGRAGASVFVSNRRRETYDHNADNFSELPELRNNSFGANLFFRPSENQKLEVSLSSLDEYRYGGEITDQPAHLTEQSEERQHRVLMSSIDYQYNFNDDNSSLIAYAAAQQTEREHYTGILPDDPAARTAFFADPPYGNSLNTTWQSGLQLNHRFVNFPLGSNVFTLGTEYLHDDVLDEIPAYEFLVDQQTRNFGAFLQSDWQLLPSLSLLSGLRMDQHNLVDRVLFSPRVSLLYKPWMSTQFRFTYGTGFRAPQAFDADLHIAFAGGGVSRISLDPNLQHERSRSLSASINYDKVEEQWIAGFTLEGFYTQLDDAFFLDPIGTDAFGERFVKRNGPGSRVQGLTLELRANYDQKAQLEGGFTWQRSRFDQAVENIDGLESRREYLRTPDEYGYATLSLFPKSRWRTTINYVFTGPMLLAHFAGAPEQDVDEYVISPAFSEFSIRSSYTLPLPRLESGLEIFGGVRNITNAYQNDFDTGKNRDSNYVYGPSLPRTFFVGVRVKSL